MIEKITRSPFKINACVYFQVGSINNKSHPKTITELQILKIVGGDVIKLYLIKAMHIHKHFKI
jgi:hypothetical protein